MTQRNARNFFNEFAILMKVHNRYKENDYTILQDVYLPRPYDALPDSPYRPPALGEKITAEDAEEIVNGIKSGDRTQLSKIHILRFYIKSLLESFLFRTTDKKNWEYHYGSPDEDNLLNVYNIEMILIPILRKLSQDLNKPVSFFGIMTPTEIMAETSLLRQTPIPEDVMTHNIRPFIGKIPKGGKTRKGVKKLRGGKRNTRRTQK